MILKGYKKDRGEHPLKDIFSGDTCLSGVNDSIATSSPIRETDD
jgi:hypothetical protein